MLRLGRVLLLAPALLGLGAARIAPAPAHPDSLSRSRVVVSGDSLRLELRCQVASVTEVLGGDADADGRLDDAELAALAQPLADYLGSHYLLRPGTAARAASPDDRPLSGALVHLAAATPDPADFPLLGPPLEWIELAVDYRAPEPVADLLVEVRLFQETSPTHRDLCLLVWEGEPVAGTMFWLDARLWRYEPAASGAPGAVGPAVAVGEATAGEAAAGEAAAGSRRPALSGGSAAWVRLGADHILSGWDHLAFVLALVLGAHGLGSLVAVVTAFTLAHSLTLALAALGVVDLPPRWIEMAIAASIAWLGLANLRARVPVSRMKEAFVFGLVHGLGFAGFLGEALAGEPRRLVPLFGFNLGVEAGQIAVVLALVAAIAVLRRAAGALTRQDAAASFWLAPRWLRLPLSAGILAAGLWWLVRRASGAG